MSPTKIQWTEATWNPVTGCDRVSAGCDHCYAMTLAKRLKAMGQPRYRNDGDPRTSGPGFAVTLQPDALDVPLHWRKPRKVFVNSMSDLFHPDVPDGFIGRVLDTIYRTPQHTYQVLTKRPQRMASWMQRWADRAGDFDHGSDLPPMPRGPEAVRAAYSSGRSSLFAAMLDDMGEPPEGCAYPLYDWMEGPVRWPETPFNLWLGTSVENQRYADLRIPHLLATPAAVRFLSVEPMLGPVDLSAWLTRQVASCGAPVRGVYGVSSSCARPVLHQGEHKSIWDYRDWRQIDWVIVGGESGPGARPMQIEWAESLVAQCQAAGVAVFVKQLGTIAGGKQHHDIETFPESLRVREYPA